MPIKKAPKSDKEFSDIEPSDNHEETNEKPKEKGRSVTFIQLFKYAKPVDYLFMAIGTLGAIASGFHWPALTILFGEIVDVFVEYEKGLNAAKDEMKIMFANSSVTSNATYMTNDEFMSSIYILSGALIASWILLTVANSTLMTFFSLSALNQIHTIKIKYFKSVLRQEIAWFDSKSSGDFASRVAAYDSKNLMIPFLMSVFRDLKRVEDGLNEKLGLAMYSVMAVIVNLVISFVYGWRLTLVVLAITPFTALATAIMNKVQATFARKEMESYAAAGNVAEEVISAIRTVYAFGGENKESERYEKNLVPAMKSGIKRNFMTGLGNGVLYSCLYFGLALGIWYGVKLSLADIEGYTIGSIVIIFWSVLGAGWNIGAAAPHFEAINMARGTAAAVFDIIEREPTIDISSESGTKPEKFEANIEFKNIGFNYPMRPEVNILNNFNLKIKSGETVALVGPSGCGKSTLIQLIQRFYDTCDGSVLIDGNDIKDLNLGWLRHQIGVVGQEPVLFDTTIKENISLGSQEKEVSDKEIEMAAIESNAHEFISKLPEGYNTYVGDRGAQMSGGQKQRIAIARALINRPKILLLDEATSALDLQSEALVQSALDKASKGRTTIIVAHRLSTIINSDRIIFIEDGKVKEMGTHSELMGKKGLYFNLVITQQINSKNTRKSKQFNDEIDLNPMNYKRTLSALSSSGNSWVTDNKQEEEEVDEEEVLKSFSQMRILKMLLMDKLYLFGGLFSSFLYGLVVPFYSYLFGLLVGIFAENTSDEHKMDETIKIALYYCAIAVGVGLVSVTQITMLGIAGERLTMRLRKMAFNAILRQEISWFDMPTNSTGSLCARLSSDAANVQGASGSRMAIICQAISTFVSSAILAFVFNWKLSLVVSAFMPLIVMGAAFSATLDNMELKSSKEANEQSSKIALEAIGSIRTVASLHQEEYFFNKYVVILEDKLRTSKKKYIFRGIVLGCCLSVILIAYAVAFIYGGILMTSGGISSQDFFIVIETLIYGAQTVGQSTVFTSDYQKAKVAAVNIFRLVDRKPISATDKQIMTERPDKCDGNITFRGCFFNYPNRPEAQILKGLSFKMHRGETVALVGSSGCGKSTSIQLIEKFYDLNHGKILLDGKDISTLDTSWVRSQMALVSQEPNLFSYSIRDNIAYGDNSRNVSMDEIVSAAQKANIHQFIKELPNGYDTNVGSKGTQLSGGQKQRIAIARALVRNPQILLLDEATSALDTASEKQVQEALDEASKGRTCLVIAHRLTTINNANKIIVIQKGMNVEEGVHEELIERKGHYYELYKMQI